MLTHVSGVQVPGSVGACSGLNGPWWLCTTHVSSMTVPYGGTPAKKKSGDGGGGAGPAKPPPEKGCLPLIAPHAERLKRKKFLVECASTGDNDFADLEGDSGAVGRVIFGGSPAALAFDLKGVIYDTSLVPSVSVLVINRTADEARVESVMSSFLRLEEREGQEAVLTAGDFENIGTMNAAQDGEDGGDNPAGDAGAKATPKKRAAGGAGGAAAKRQKAKSGAPRRKGAGAKGGRGAGKATLGAKAKAKKKL